MEDLVGEYKESREKIRRGIRSAKERKKLTKEDEPEREIIKWDLSQLESMLRDITEIIANMKARRTYADLRGYTGSRTVLMDPSDLLEIKASRIGPEAEIYLRNGIKERMGEDVRKRLTLLTIKQQTTLTRWIDQEITISNIAREDNVSRQAVWIRIFGDKTNRGALKILRGDDQHGEERLQD